MLYLDLNGKAYKEKGELKEVLDTHIKKWQEQFGITLEPVSPEIAFSLIIQKVC